MWIALYGGFFGTMLLIGIFYKTNIPIFFAPWLVFSLALAITGAWHWKNRRPLGDEDKKFPSAERTEELLRKIFPEVKERE